MPSTSSVSQITTTSNNLHRSTDETSKQISKQYVSDYILSQPFDNNDEEEIHQNHSSPPVVQRKRILPTAHIQRQQQIVNVANPSTGKIFIQFISFEFFSGFSFSEDLRRNNNWQKDEILAAKLENFLSTVNFFSCLVVSFVVFAIQSINIFFRFLVNDQLEVERKSNGTSWLRSFEESQLDFVDS